MERYNYSEKEIIENEERTLKSAIESAKNGSYFFAIVMLSIEKEKSKREEFKRICTYVIQEIKNLQFLSGNKIPDDCRNVLMEGYELHRKGKYEEAKQKFIKAKNILNTMKDVLDIEPYVKICDSDIKNCEASSQINKELERRYKEELKKQEEQRKLEERRKLEAKRQEETAQLYKYFNEAINLFNNKCYEESKKLFLQVRPKITKNDMLERCDRLIKRCEEEIREAQIIARNNKASALCDKAYELFSVQGDYYEAKRLYEEAKQLFTYKNKVAYCDQMIKLVKGYIINQELYQEDERRAKELFRQANSAYNSRNFLQAFKLFNEAAELSKDGSLIYECIEKRIDSKLQYLESNGEYRKMLLYVQEERRRVSHYMLQSKLDNLIISLEQRIKAENIISEAMRYARAGDIRNATHKLNWAAACSLDPKVKAKCNSLINQITNSSNCENQKDNKVEDLCERGRSYYYNHDYDRAINAFKEAKRKALYDDSDDIDDWIQSCYKAKQRENEERAQKLYDEAELDIKFDRYFSAQKKLEEAIELSEDSYLKKQCYMLMDECEEKNI